MALEVGRRRCELRLQELAAEGGGMDYESVVVAVARLGNRLQRDK